MEGGRDVDDVRDGAAEKMRNGGFDGVECAQDVNVHNGLEGVGAEACDGGNKVSSCTSTVESEAMEEPFVSFFL